MVRQVGDHAVDQAQIVGVLSQLGHAVGNPQTALAVLTKARGREKYFQLFCCNKVRSFPEANAKRKR